MQPVGTFLTFTFTGMTMRCGTRGSIRIRCRWMVVMTTEKIPVGLSIGKRRMDVLGGTRKYQWTVSPGGRRAMRMAFSVSHAFSFPADLEVSMWKCGLCTGRRGSMVVTDWAWLLLLMGMATCRLTHGGLAERPAFSFTAGLVVSMG